MIERERDAARPNLDVLCRCCQRCSQDGGVGIESTEGMQVPFWNPDGSKSMLICVMSRFEHHIILVCSATRTIVREKD